MRHASGSFARGAALRIGPLLGALAAFAAGCGGGADAQRGPTIAPGASPSSSAALAPLPSASAVPASSAVDAARRRPGRTALGEPAEEALELEVMPVAGGLSALLVAARGDERGAYVRRIDGEAGRPGPVIALVDERPVAAFDGGAGRFTLVTSTGESLCVATFEVGSPVPLARGCKDVRAQAVTVLGDGLALVEVAVVDAPRPAPSAATKPKAPSAKPKAPRRTDRRVAGPDRRGDRPKTPKKRAAEGGRRGPSPKVKVELRLRRVGRDGAFADDATPTGLAFQRPLDGMTLVDAAARAGGVDVLWYEAQPRPARASALGAADLVWAHLGPSGEFEPSSRVAVAGGDLEFGWIRGHDAPRLLVGEAGSAVLTLGDKDRACDVVRVAPSRARLAPERALCALDPLRLASPSPPPASEVAALGALLASDPRRVLGQPRADVGLAAWARDRAWFLVGGALRSAGRDGAVREEPAPFVARRQRVAWGALASDGEGVAIAGARVWGLDASGDVRDRGAAPSTTPSAEPARAPTVSWTEPASSGRVSVARVGTTWLAARGDVVRLAPEPALVTALRGRAHPDTSALVGGARRGLFVDIASGVLSIDAVDEAGNVTPLRPASARVPAPVRPGFAAVARTSGGAIVAGVRAGEPPKVVAIAIDEEGHVGAARETSLPVRAGELAMRLVALPDGGAVLADAARKHVVWLDDDARELASAPWPAGSSEAACLDGEPARVVVPGPEPGRLVRVPALAEPGTCVVGDPVWARDGSLRWFGSDARGLDAVAEVGVVRLGPPPPARAPESRAIVDASLSGAVRAPCPAEMVAIAGRYCVDRFEAALVDRATGRSLAPDWPIAPALLDRVLEAWSTQRERVGDLHARAFPLPAFPAWERVAEVAPVATSRLGARPNGYVTGLGAEAACAAAGKRLCTRDEFVVACRGEGDTLFPYGDDYVDGACNVFREEHPAALLHGNPSVGHLDPRLDRVRTSKGEPLLRETGATPACRSRWGADAVYDMVGNLDEWIDEPGGAFAGGFFARSTRSGCEAIVTNHPKPYLDYSTGVRCCRDVAK